MNLDTVNKNLMAMSAGGFHVGRYFCLQTNEILYL